MSVTNTLTHFDVFEVFTMVKLFGKNFVILPRDYATPICLGYHGWRNTNRVDPISFAPFKVAKASRAGTLTMQNHTCFCQKTLPM